MRGAETSDDERVFTDECGIMPGFPGGLRAVRGTPL